MILEINRSENPIKFLIAFSLSTKLCLHFFFSKRDCFFTFSKNLLNLIYCKKFFAHYLKKSITTLII